MNVVVNVALVGLGLTFSAPSFLLAQTNSSEQPGSSRIRACSLLPKEEVKKHLPWNSVLDQMQIEEESIGASGSACNYPSVYIQVLPFSQGMVDSLHAKGGLEAVDGVGDEAYFHNNADRYAEVFVKVGEHMLTLQANVDGDIESVKPNVLNLANALVAELR